MTIEDVLYCCVGEAGRRTGRDDVSRVVEATDRERGR